MPIKEPDNINWLATSILFVITLIGSIANYAYRVIQGHAFNVVTLVAQVCVSIFAGCLMFFIASEFQLDFELAGGLCGLAGWSGAGMVTALERRLIKKLEDN